MNCCEETPSVTAPPTSSERAGLLASAGAVASALLSSACCWLPLMLLAFGVSAGSVGGFLDAYRPWLLGAAGVLLATAFYLTYFRKAACAPDGSCTTPRPRLILFNKVMLWVATAVVLTFALFPNYVGLILGGEEPAVPQEQAEALETVTLRVEGMTCAACEVHVRSALQEVPGVHHASVSYDDSRATVQVEAGVDRQALLEAVAKTGYRGSVQEQLQ